MEYIRYCIKCGSKKIYKNLDSYRSNKNSLLCRTCARIDVFDKLYPNKIYKLLEDNPESYYWIGYLLSDGNFNEKNNRLKFSQNNQDVISVYNFSNFIEYNHVKEVNNSATLSIRSDRYIPKIIKKFDIKSNKTYIPPSEKIFEEMDIDLLAYLFIGFVDGDGCIKNLTKRKDFNLRIKVHKSWSGILHIFRNRLFGNSGYETISKDGYAIFCVGDSEVLKSFKNKYILNINFNILTRKWDIIDMNFISKYVIANERLKRVRELYMSGMCIKDICKTLNLKYGLVYKDIKKINSTI